jgi:hypothetical protein
VEKANSLPSFSISGNAAKRSSWSKRRMNVLSSGHSIAQKTGNVNKEALNGNFGALNGAFLH